VIVNVVTGIEEARDAAASGNWRLVGALGYLGFDIAVLYVTLLAVGQPVSVPALMLAYALGYLANTVPIPGGIGVLDAGLTGAIVLYGASPIHAAGRGLVLATGKPRIRSDAGRGEARRAVAAPPRATPSRAPSRS
jgi:hypothetical protein